MSPAYASDSRRMKFFIVSVATTAELSPSVYAGAKFSPSTSTLTSQANTSSPSMRCTGTRSLP